MNEVEPRKLAPIANAKEIRLYLIKRSISMLTLSLLLLLSGLSTFSGLHIEYVRWFRWRLRNGVKPYASWSFASTTRKHKHSVPVRAIIQTIFSCCWKRKTNRINWRLSSPALNCIVITRLELAAELQKPAPQVIKFYSFGEVLPLHHWSSFITRQPSIMSSITVVTLSYLRNLSTRLIFETLMTVMTTKHIVATERMNNDE